MPSNTGYNPQHEWEFEKSKLNADGQGVQGSATAGSTTNFDVVLTDDCLYTGVWIAVSGSANGDAAKLQVIDTNGITGFPPGTVLLQAVNWGIPGFNFSEQFDYNYPAKVLATMTIRIIYTSAAGLLGGAPYCVFNHKLHKVLI